MLYELHIGSFTGGGSLLDAAERLIHIRDLGFLVFCSGFLCSFFGGCHCESCLILVSWCIRVLWDDIVDHLFQPFGTVKDPPTCK